MRAPLSTLSPALRLLLPFVFCSCEATAERLKELALPDQLHLYYEDHDGEYESKQFTGRGFDEDGRSLGLGLSWSLALPPEPAPGLTREDLHALLLEVRTAATAAVSEASAPAEKAAAAAERAAAELAAAERAAAERVAAERAAAELAAAERAAAEALTEPPPQAEPTETVAVEITPEREPESPVMGAPAMSVAGSFADSPIAAEPSGSRRRVIIIAAGVLGLGLLCARLLGRTAQKA